MTHLIDKSAVIAEIEKKRDAALTRQHNLEAIGQVTVLNETLARELSRIISFINTLEVKEVDSNDAVSATIDFPLIGYDFPNIYPNYKELKEYCIRHYIKDNDKVKITIVKEK